MFQNSYVQFELPDRWECKMEGTEWVCSSLLKDQSKEAIFVLTAKEVGPSDTLEAYEAHLKTPKSIPNAEGKPSQSQMKNITRNQINGHVWIDSLHLGSEIPQYYTRYLATTKDRLAILVTFSAHQLHYSKYSTDILNAVKSLVVKAQFNLKPSMPGMGPGGSSGSNPIGPNFSMNTEFDELPPEPKAKSPAKFIALFVLIAAAGAYLYLRKRKK